MGLIPMLDKIYDEVTNVYWISRIFFGSTYQLQLLLNF